MPPPESREILWQRLLKAADEHSGGRFGPALLQAKEEFAGGAQREPAWWDFAVDQLRQLSPHRAAIIAVICGAAVEGGLPASRTGPAILKLFESWLLRFPQVAEGAQLPEECGEHLAAFPMLAQAVVAHLARLPELRAQLAGDGALDARLNELEAHSHGASWVRSALTRASGVLVVIHPPSAKALRLRFTNVADAFHLFSLIQCAIGPRLPGGKIPDPKVVEAAWERSGEMLEDSAWWHYGDPRSPRSDAMHSIWGDARVRDLPRIGDELVILLWPPIFAGRSWSGGLSAALEALPVNIELLGELPPEETKGWLQRLKLAVP